MIVYSGGDNNGRPEGDYGQQQVSHSYSLELLKPTAKLVAILELDC